MLRQAAAPPSITVPPTLDEVFSDLKMSGWIDASMLNAGQRSISVSNLTRTAIATKNNLVTAATTGSLFGCLSDTPLTGISDQNGFGFTLGFNQCSLGDSTSLTKFIFNGTVELSGSVHVDEFDLASKTFLFTPQFTIKPVVSFLVGGAIDKQFDELVPVTISFVFPPTPLIPVPIPLTVDIGLQVGATASGGFRLAERSGTWIYAPVTIGLRNGQAIRTATNSFTPDPFVFDPISVGVDASVTIEPFVALAIGKSIDKTITIDLARFRLLAGLDRKSVV